MAITIITNPNGGNANNLSSPVYNPIYFNVSSTNTAQPNFSYVFQLYTGSTATGVPISTIKLLPRPSVGNAIYNPARIFESFLSYDINVQNITASTQGVYHLTNYVVKMGEEYGLLTTGTTIYSGLTGFSGNTFNGVLEYTEIPSWPITWLNRFGVNQNGGSSGNQQFMTNQPRTGVFIRNATDRGSVDFINGIPVSFVNLQINVYHMSGGSTTYIYTNVIPSTGWVHIPSGIWNINNLGHGTLININTDISYDITLIDASMSFTSESILYIIDKSCNKYNTVRLQFLNRLGGWDYFNFNLLSRKTVNITRNTYKKVLPYNYSIGNRQTTIIDMDGTFNYELNSDWIGDATSTWLEELITSNEIYMIDSNGNARPVQMVEGSQEIKKQINDKLFNYTYNFTSSYEINTQRG